MVMYCVAFGCKNAGTIIGKYFFMFSIETTRYPTILDKGSSQRALDSFTNVVTRGGLLYALDMWCKTFNILQKSNTEENCAIEVFAKIFFATSRNKYYYYYNKVSNKSSTLKSYGREKYTAVAIRQSVWDNQSSMNNTSQSSLEGTFLVSNHSTSTICNPGYLEVSSDCLKRNHSINESNEEMQLDYSENGNGQKNTPNCFLKSILTDSDDDMGDPDYNLEKDSSSYSCSEEDEKTENFTDLNEKIFQCGSSKQIKKKPEIDSESGKRVPVFSSDTLQNRDKLISVEIHTNKTDLAENKSSSSEKFEDGNNNNLSSQLITVNHRYLGVETSNHNTKKHFCIFCKTKQTQLARHFLIKHRNEKDVMFFSKLPVKSMERLSIISKLRKQGDALYNCNENYNNGDIIVVRRPQVDKKRNAQHYLPCGECSAMYSILSIRAHYKRCKTEYKFQRNVLVESHSRTFTGWKANSIMRNKILPSMMVDEIGRLVRNEDLIILFGNRLTQKYRSPRLHKMIRSRLRCVANFYWHYKQINPQIRNFGDVFNPQNYEEVIISINKIAGLNEDTGQYKAPATAANIGTYLKTLSLYLISEMIKQKNSRKLQDVRKFLQLLEHSVTQDILKTVHENQLTTRRNKIISLPSINDISLLRDHLNEKLKLNFGKLRKKFSISAWKELSGALLIALQLFNRRRAREIERIKIHDFVQHELVNVDDEMACDSKGERIENYIRFLIREKEGRDFPVFMDKYELKCLKLVLEYREMAGTPVTNPYVFGISGKDKFQHLDANKLIVRYANTCGAKHPERLRGTQLRKHFATKCETMQLNDIEMKAVADYMGHHEKIHLEHYRMPNATRDIVRMSQLLEKAQGVESSSSFIELNPICNIDPSEAEKQDESAPLEKNADGLELNSSRRCSIKRLSWNIKEKALVDTKAKFYIENFKSPTLSICSTLIKEDELPKNRTPNTLKAYMMNRIKRRKESLLTPKTKKCKRGVKKYSTDEEREGGRNISE